LANVTSDFTNVATVKGTYGSTTVQASDDALVDVPPTVDLTKSVTPSTLPEPGGLFTYTLAIHNTSAEAVTITALTDSNTLSPQCFALVNTSLAAGASNSCTYTVTRTRSGLTTTRRQ